MPLFLTQRNENLIEWMDRPDCDANLLNNTYHQFTTINRLLSGWESIYKQKIRPILESTQGVSTILDIGCGGGDIIKYLHQLCQKDQLNVRFTGIDPDTRSIQFLSSQKWPENIQFHAASSAQLVEKNQQFDIVISNHLMHHLDNESLNGLCRDAEKLSRRLVLFSDIERSDFGYVAFSLFSPLIFRQSYIVSDGQISIKRSFRKDELQQILPDGWQVKPKFPFRLLALFEDRIDD